jgi:hypothetical protein
MINRIVLVCPFSSLLGFDWLVWAEADYMADKIPKPTEDGESGVAEDVDKDAEPRREAKKPKLANPRVFFEISIGGRPAGRIVMELRADVVPSKLFI